LYPQRTVLQVRSTSLPAAQRENAPLWRRLDHVEAIIEPQKNWPTCWAGTAADSATDRTQQRNPTDALAAPLPGKDTIRSVLRRSASRAPAFGAAVGGDCPARPAFRKPAPARGAPCLPARGRGCLICSARTAVLILSRRGKVYRKKIKLYQTICIGSAGSPWPLISSCAVGIAKRLANPLFASPPAKLHSITCSPRRGVYGN